MRRVPKRPPGGPGGIFTVAAVRPALPSCGMGSECRYPEVILATCPIPWTEVGEFDEDNFRTAVRHLRRDLTPYLYLFGTAGEGYAVSDAQYIRVARVFREEMPGEPHAMIGVISLSLATVVERIAIGRDMGFREFQVSLPSWGALTDREVDLFFRETCGRFPDCSFLHYNLPRVKRVLQGPDYARLAARHPNLVAIKMGGTDFAAQAGIATAAPALRCFFTENSFAELRGQIACGLLASISTIHFGRARELHAARGPQLAALRAELSTIHAAMKSAVGTAAHMDGAFDKLYIKLHVPDFPLRLLPPYTSTNDAIFEAFRAAIPAEWRP